MPDTGKLREELGRIRKIVHKNIVDLPSVVDRLAAVVEEMLEPEPAEPDYVSPPMRPVGKFVGRFVSTTEPEPVLTYPSGTEFVPRQQLDVAVAALEQIREHQGKVCADYCTCRHESCRSSYSSWTIADEALSKIAALKS